MKTAGMIAAPMLLLLACDGKVETTDTAVVLEGPALSHGMPEGPFYEGSTVEMLVGADDEDGVAGVTLFFRTTDSDYWNQRPMESSDSGDTWSVALSGDEVGAPGLEYYFRSEDLGLVAASSYLPLAGSDEPFVLDVVRTGQGLPFVEDFEADSLFALGWVNVWYAFGGYPWQITDMSSSSGDRSVIHQRGLEDGTEMDDWLISPALDFSGEEKVQVGWNEYGTSISGLSASLWISTGSRDPEDGDFVEVASLSPSSESEWVRAPVVDLSAWGGEPMVYLAWRYAGVHAGDWYMDDVEVRDLACDLDVSLVQPDQVLSAGDTFDMTVSLSNRTSEPCGALDAALSFPQGGAVASPTSAEIAAGLELDGEATFQVTIDQDFLENSYLAVQADVSASAQGDAWDAEADVLVGLASEGRLEVSTLADGNVQVFIGVGDPENPIWEELIYGAYESAGTVAVSVDLTDKRDYLPPSPGEGRWFVSVTTDADASVERFEVDYAGEVTAATNHPTWYGPGTGIAYAPDPPSPIIVQKILNPTSISPGEAGVTLEFVLYNEGAESDGRVEASLTSSDADVTVQTPGPVSVADTTWAAGEVAALSTPFSFDVSADHTDSTDVELALLVVEYDQAGTTEIGSWSLPVSVEVPWPVLKATAIQVNDDDDDDGLLEPGESAELEVDIRNVGALATFGPVSGYLVVGAGSTAVMSTTSSASNDETLGNLSVGLTRTVRFDVTLDAAAAQGDLLDLSLALDDGTQSYDVGLELVVGERPWVAFSASDDAIGDHYDYEFDLLNGYYRTDGTTMEMLYESAQEFDLSAAFVETWMVASGGQYSFYRVVLQGGVAQLQGYDSGFQTLPSPVVESVDATRVKVSWPLDDMQLATSSLRVGLGAGWCGNDTGSFCDHFPNGWGYYYNSTYNSSGLFNIDW